MPLRVVPSPTGLPSKRCPGIGFLSRADRKIGVVQHMAPHTGLVSNFLLSRKNGTPSPPGPGERPAGAGRAVPRRKPGGGLLQPGSAACRLAREDGSLSALRLGRTIPRREAAAGVHAGPSRLGSGCPRSHPYSVPAADTNIPWHGGPVRHTPPHPPTRIHKFSLSATQASPGEAESGLRPPLLPWGAPRANNKLRQRPRGRGRRNMYFNEDSFPLV